MATSLITQYFKSGDISVLPAALWQVEDPPEGIYLQGTERAFAILTHLPERGLAVVGTRHPSANHALYLRNWLHHLSDSDLVIVSGFARGIDTVAHEAALEAGLPTVAIMGSGLDVCYPRQNERLRQQILEKDSLLVSEYPPGSEPRGFHFLNRNRLIAAWSKAVWVVQAGARSGALNTASWARSHHRLCFTLPCFPGDLLSAGNQDLLDRHHALPFWGLHSLGAAWLELSTRSSKIKVKDLKVEEAALFSRVLFLSEGSGGAEVQGVLDWALSLDWSPARFFETLGTLVDKRLVVEKNGLLLKNPDHSA